MAIVGRIVSERSCLAVNPLIIGLIMSFQRRWMVDEDDWLAVLEG